ncbi:MAG TPA: hypothetical protein VHC45_16850 [Gaiellaceae bacterium]|nr:hypothetical protein [Gaiellaceae bacterium]
MFDSPRPRRGDALLLAHCTTGRRTQEGDEPERREPAADRLERQVGASLARLLVRALGRR